MGSLLDVALAMVGVIAWAPAFYLGFLTFFSAKLPIPPEPEPLLKFDIVVPAHNEELGIARTVQNLLLLRWPKELFRVIVVADNCTDSTAKNARQAGATVLPRQDDEFRGKGYALNYAFEWILGESQADAVVVVDADTVVSENLLAAFAARLENNIYAVQAHYGVLDEKPSWRTRLMRIAFSTFHGVRSLGRERLGLSCGLRGNGMCFSKGLLSAIPHDAFSVVEDVEYGIRLGQAGYRVAYAHEAYVLGEMVTGEKASRSQRRRWESGRWELMRLHGLPLLRDAYAKGDAMLLDLAMDVLVPQLSWVVLSVAAMWVLSAIGSTYTERAWFSWSVANGAAFCLCFYVARGFVLAEVGLRGLLDLIYVPGYVFWKIWLAITPSRSKKGEWVRTTREAEEETTETEFKP